MHKQDEQFQRIVAAAEERARQSAAEAAWARDRLAEAERALEVPGLALHRYEERAIVERSVRDRAVFDAASLRAALTASEERLRALEQRNTDGAKEVHWLREQLEKVVEMERVSRLSAEKERQAAVWLQGELIQSEEALAKSQNELRRLHKQMEASRREVDEADGWTYRTEAPGFEGQRDGMVSAEDYEALRHDL